MTETNALGSCLRRQLAEVEAIRAMYSGEGEFDMTDVERSAVEILSELDESATSAPDYLSISFRVHLLGTTLGGRHVSTTISFPKFYPEREPLRVSVECGGLISKQEHEIISLGCQEAANESTGEEAVLQVLQKLHALAWELEEASKSSTHQEIDTICSNGLESSECIERRVIWFHHIKSTKKRKDILEWGAELRLGGYCKPGFPGVLIFEGTSESVLEYVKRIQRLKWQALQIRGQEEETLTEGQDLDSLRRFPIGIKELLESGMSELAGKCREANLEQLFLTALKISR